jgi:hypothetical protein
MAGESGSGGKFSKKKKWTITGALSVAASIASILAYLSSAGGSNNTTGPSTGSSGGTEQSQTVYPASVQQDFLGQCEQTGSTVAQCQCGLSWLESNVTLGRFQADLTQFDQGVEPGDLVTAREVCNS